MKRVGHAALTLAVVLLLALSHSGRAQESLQPARAPARNPRASAFERSARPFLQTYCNDCHSGSEPQGNLTLEDIDRKVAGGDDFEVWRMIYERVKFGLMPPEDESQPSDAERKKFLGWIREELLKEQHPGGVIPRTLQLPRYGNYIDHKALFSRETAENSVGSDVVIPARPRLWRLRPQIHQSLDISDAGPKKSHGFGEALNVVNSAEFEDYAVRYFVDEPTTGMLLANAEKMVPVRSQDALRMLTGSERITPEDAVAAAIQKTFLQILHRESTIAEVARFSKFHRRIEDAFGRQIAAEKLLTAIYMQPEALFREELGAGPPDQYGRIRLTQLEIALAISYALGNRTDALLLEAAGQSQLTTRQQIVDHVQRRFDAPPKFEGNPRLLEFFRQYFNYPHADDVFKNPAQKGVHRPRQLVTDLDLLVEHVMKKDKHVLFTLLTTNEYFVDSRRDPDSGELHPSNLDQPNDDSVLDRESEYASVYGLPRDWFWTDQQPVVMPRHMRAGVLTHPAWLVAWSGNFDNHPVQRGKWIRTHLLGGTIPKIPINVDAAVPEDIHKQLRERLTMATADTECRRCHQKMDPLGLPFEQFDHYGRFRIRETGRPVDTSGAIAFTDDDTLTGDVETPIELVHQLARSVHVEQVFVRHAFRYFMGRNETLGDAKTMQDAHRAYRDAGGSFRALVTSLLSSDSFLLRRADTH